MSRLVSNLILAIWMGLCLFPITGHATPPEIWFEDSNLGKPGGLVADFNQRFSDLNSWPRTRSRLAVQMVRASSLLNVANRLDDDFLAHRFTPVLKSSGIRLVLDVQGATGLSVKPGVDALMRREFGLIERLIRLGGNVHSVALQSVLSKPVLNDTSSQPYT